MRHFENAAAHSSSDSSKARLATESNEGRRGGGLVLRVLQKEENL